VSFTANNVAIAGCGAVAVSKGYAACATNALTTAGTFAIRATYGGNGSYSAGVAGPITQTVSGTAKASEINVQGLWWGSAAESGWGVNLTQQGDITFGTWFTYDANGKGQWLVMPRGDRVSANTFSGALYRTTGPSYTAASFNASQVQSTVVGTATFTFSDANNGVFTATVNGMSTTKAITRQVFDVVPTCTAGGTTAGSTNYQDLWWRSGGVESGWGLNIAHQGNTMFVTWFTYDTDGTGLWLVGSNVAKTGTGTYAGTLYRTTGPAFNVAQWNPGDIGVTPVGTVSLAFSDANNGVFTYTVNGVTQSKPVTRQVFSTPPTVCH
jgi:hypothetical protein